MIKARTARLMAAPESFGAAETRFWRERDTNSYGDVGAGSGGAKVEKEGKGKEEGEGGLLTALSGGKTADEESDPFWKFWRYRKVSVRGRWDYANEVLVGPRSPPKGDLAKR